MSEEAEEGRVPVRRKSASMINTLLAAAITAAMGIPGGMGKGDIPSLKEFDEYTRKRGNKPSAEAKKRNIERNRKAQKAARRR